MVNSNADIEKKQLKSRFYPYFIFGLVMIVSLLPRLILLNRISSRWRTSQTLLTSYWFQKEGISLFHAQLPLYGPPWELPLEFPLYQAMSTIFSNLTKMDLTIASRIVGLLCFYLSAVFLFLLCYEFLSNYKASLIIFSVYLWLPYTIRYSTEILIDYLSVALALGFIYFLRKFFVSRQEILFCILAILFGVLGGVVKVTTMAIIIIPAILVALDGLHQWGWNFDDLRQPKQIWSGIRNEQKKLVPLIMLGCMAGIPAVAIVLWTRYADGIKHASVFTNWLASDNLPSWIYGTIDQKISFINWMNWLATINNNFLMKGILGIFLLIGIVYLYKMPVSYRAVFGAALSSVFLTLFIFFNLYLHDYYYIAVSPYMSILVGFGIYCFAKYILPEKNWYLVFAILFSFFVMLKWIEQYTYHQANIYHDILHVQTKYIPLAEKTRQITPEEEYIIAIQNDWYPDFILYTQRKGFTLTPREYETYTCDFFTENNFSTVVVVDPPDDADLVNKVLDCFSDYESMGDDIYRVVR